MNVLTVLALLLIAAAIISLILSFMGMLVVGALKLLPFVLLALAVLFILKGGRVHIEFPDKRDRDER